MYFFNSTYDVVVTFLIMIFSLILSVRLNRPFELKDKVGLYLFIWHTMFCVVYFIYSQYNPADANGYYIRSLNIEKLDFSLGTKFVEYLTSVLSYYLGFSAFNCFLIYNLFGYIGMLGFFGSLNKLAPFQNQKARWLSLLIIVLPAVSFWSSSIGKDAISFMSAGLTLWAALNFKKRMVIFIFAIIAMLMVRPHVAAVMITAYSLAFVFDTKSSILQRMIVGSITLVASAAVIPLAMQYAGLGDAQSAADIQDYIDQRQSYNLEGGSSVDISSMNLPLQLFTYLFRPLPFEASSIFSLAASFDNLILLFLAIFGAIAIMKKTTPLVDSNRAFLWIYVAICLLIFSTTTANLGIALRQKWMFAPMLIFLLLSIIGRKKVNNKVLS